MQNLKNKQMNKHYKRNKSTENRGVVARREGVGGGETGVKGIKRYRLLGTGCFLYSLGFNKGHCHLQL